MILSFLSNLALTSRILDDLSMLSLDDEASLSVDALVADSLSDTNRIPTLSDYEMASRTSTPSVPPGFSLPHAHPGSAAPFDMAAIRPQTTSTFSPVRPVSTSATSTSRTGSSRPHTPTPQPFSTQPALPLKPIASASQAKSDPKTLVTQQSNISKVNAPQTHPLPAQSILQPEDFPELGKGKPKETIPPTGPRSMTQSSKKQAPAISNAAFALTPDDKSIDEKSSVAQSSKKMSAAIEPPAKAATSSGGFPPLPPSTPINASTTAAARVTGKALRLMPTSKTESPTADTSTPVSASSSVPPAFPSRQASLASNARLDRPATPLSESVSDNASITSASISRPGSPPSSKIGTAPVRSTTKSQQKKQRREAQKEKEKPGVVETPEPEVEIAPIIGRKKKQKKEKSSSSAIPTPPARSQTASPKVVETAAKEKAAELEQKPNAETETSQKPKEGNPDPKPSEVKSKGNPSTEVQTPNESEITPDAPETIIEAPKPVPVPSSILQDLMSSGVLPDPSKLVVFKPVTGSTQRPEFNADLEDMNHKLMITEEDRAALLAGNPVHKVTQANTRIMLTSNGDCVRNLTPAEEERYLEIQAEILRESGPGAFVPPSHTANTGFTLIGGRAVPNGPPSFFPQADKNGKPAIVDPVSKIQRDEALSYINQYVLPALSTNSQLERALNANALGTDMLRPNDLGWEGIGRGTDPLGTTGSSQAEGDSAYGDNYGHGILATGLESMTAHFATGRENNRGQPLGNVTLLSLTESETAMQAAKKETEKLEKSLNQLLKKNKRLLLGGSGH